MWKQCKRVDDSTMEEALKLISLFNADMLGTEIYNPLKYIYEHIPKKAKHTFNVFLLTDGEVPDPDKVIALIKANQSQDTRVYTLGIGTGCSKYLILNAAVNGLCEFADSPALLSEKVIYMLQDSMSPFIGNLKVQCDAPLKLITPNPDSIVSIKKNQRLTFSCFFDDLRQDSKIKLSYMDYSTLT